MYKLVVFAAFLAVASAAPGLIGSYGAPLAAPYAPWGGLAHGYVGSPYVGSPYVGAPVVKTAVPVATSYANTVRIASPALAVAHAPVVAAHAPVLAPAYAHGW